MDKKNSKKKTYGLEHWKLISLYLVGYDVIAVTLAYFLALLLRFDFAVSRIPIIYLQPWALFAPFYAVICILVFWRARLYRSIWRFASFTELLRITQATIATTVIHIVGVTITLNILIRGTEYTLNRMPFSYYILGGLLQFILIVAIRFAYRFILLLRASRDRKAASNIMLIGAGSAGQMILRDIRRTSAADKNGAMDERVVCIIDDNKNKWNRDVDGVPVVGLNSIIGTT